jgi:hypothetical protein
VNDFKQLKKMKKITGKLFQNLASGTATTLLVGAALTLTGCEGLLLYGGAKNKKLDEKRAPTASTITESPAEPTDTTDTLAPSAASSIGWAQSSPYNSTAAAISVYKDVV